MWCVMVSNVYYINFKIMLYHQFNHHFNLDFQANMKLKTKISAFDTELFSINSMHKFKFQLVLEVDIKYIIYLERSYPGRLMSHPILVLCSPRHRSKLRRQHYQNLLSPNWKMTSL